MDFIYPWLPDKCSICTKWGHTHKTCKSRVKLLRRHDDSESAVQKVTLETRETETSLPADIEGTWRDVSPSKHRWQGTKPVTEHTTVISPSRFAVLLEEGNNDELERKDETGERDVSNNVTEEGRSSNDTEREEGEIPEVSEEISKVVSTEVSEEDSEEDTGTDDHLNTNVRKAGKIEKGERPPRPTISRFSKTNIKSSKKLAALSVKEGLPNAAGKKRNSKKK